MNKAVFLDRDGVINREKGEYTYLPKDFILNDIIEALQEFQKKGYLLIVITNQSGIAKGIYTHQQLNDLNLHLINILNNNGITLTEIYYCPHHPDSGKCICRKPDSLLLEKAIARFNIDASASYFIGDAQRDESAGKKAGVSTILIEPNSSLTKVMQMVK